MELILTILFSVLTVFLVLAMVLFTVVSIFLILIAKNIYQVCKVIKKEGEKVAVDIENLRSSVQNGGMKFASMALSVLSFFKHHKKSKKKDE